MPGGTIADRSAVGNSVYAAGLRARYSTLLR